MTDLPARAVWALLIGFLAIVGAYVALAITGAGTDGFLTFLATIVPVLGVGVHQEVRQRQNAGRLDKIDHQTNGALTARLHDAAATEVRAALAEVGYPITVPGTPAVAAAPAEPVGQ